MPFKAQHPHLLFAAFILLVQLRTVDFDPSPAWDLGRPVKGISGSSSGIAHPPRHDPTPGDGVDFAARPEAPRDAPNEEALEFFSFFGLASAVWLGLYLVGQPQRSTVSWLTALTLWSLAGIFLDSFLAFNQPAIGFQQQIAAALDIGPGPNEAIARLLTLGWVSKLAIVFWVHATSLMAPGGMTAWRRSVVGVGYALAALTILVQILRPDWLTPPHFTQGLAGFLEPGTIYPIPAVSLIVLIAFSLANLAAARRAAPAGIVRRQFGLLVAATICAGLSGPLFILGDLYAESLPTSEMLLLLAMVLLGYGVAQYSAIVAGRTIRRHFVYSLTAVGLVTMLYFVVAYLSSVSFGVRMAGFAFMILLAVVTHSLTGNARALLDYFFVDPETRRALQVLRRVSSGVGGADRLEDRLHVMLDSLCTQARASFGLLLRVTDGTVRLAATHRWPGRETVSLSPADLASDDILSLAPDALPAVPGAALLAPLYIDTELVGAVVLGHPVNGAQYAPDEVEVIGFATDWMAEALRVDRLQGEAIERMAGLSETFRPMGGLAGEAPSLDSVEGALRRINDYLYLGSSPVARLRTVSERLPSASATHVDRGKATHRVLAEAIEKLRPEGPRPAPCFAREWHHYMILHEAYVEERPNREVMAELYISEGTFNRRRREAIEAVARILREAEASPPVEV